MRLDAGLIAATVVIAAATPPPAPVATLTAPAGWSRQELFGKFAPGMVGIYNDLSRRTGDFIPKIFLTEETAPGVSLHDSVHDALAALTETGYRIHANRPQAVCGGHRPGWFISYVKPGPEPLTVEQTRLLVNRMLYTATYVRLSSQRDDPAARHALTTLCVKAP
jgi:hypothetical protein